MKPMSVVVVYEDAGAQEAAVAFCDRLVQKFWVEHGFEVSWWPLVRLQESRQAEEAGRKAAEACVVVFAVEPQRELPGWIKRWTEQWGAQRQEREGALVLLGAHSAESGAAPVEPHCFLRQLAHQSGMDFLTEVPQNLSFGESDSPEACAERARQIGSVLDGILHQVTPPPRLPF
jgi:hypothetical protein